MPKICYKRQVFSESSLAIIAQAVAIVDEYSAQGYQLTLRQLYYQFVARDLLDNTLRSYKRLGSIVNDGRLAGLIDWDSITDRTRNLQANSHWETPGEIIESAAHSYRRDLWADQDHRVEVWIEKDALIGVIEGPCRELDVPYFSCRGYTSQSEMWTAAQRLADWSAKGQEPLVIHLGDHDPSGMDMTRDVLDRLALLSEDTPLEVDRIALNHDQVEQYRPPPNPAKITDSRCAGYIRRFGRESWELDALEPAVIADLVRARIRRVLDTRKFNAAKKRQERERKELTRLAANWTT